MYYLRTYCLLSQERVPTKIGIYFQLHIASSGIVRRHGSKDSMEHYCDLLVPQIFISVSTLKNDKRQELLNNISLLENQTSTLK